MTRYYDRLLTWGSAPMTRTGLDFLGRIRDDLLEATVVDVGEVARWLYAETDQEYWMVARDFPTILSPFEMAFYEYKHPGWVNSSVHGYHYEPRATYGFLVRVLGVDGDDRAVLADSYSRFRATAPGAWEPPAGRTSNAADARWVMQVAVFMEREKNRPSVGPMGMMEFPVMGDGSAATWAKDEAAFKTLQMMATAEQIERDPEAARTLNDGLQTALYPVLMGISLAHCKNVSLQDHVPPEKPSRKHEKKHGRPLAPYKTLMIEPFKTAARDTPPEGDRGRASTALKLYRGHFKTFTTERPLFGRHAGTYWWSPRAKEGAKRDYEVAAPPTSGSPLDTGHEGGNR